MRILVLGHKGLLGNCVAKYLSLHDGLEIITTEKRWPLHDFIEFVKNERLDWIINCIAQIPQSKPTAPDLFNANLGLPVFLASLDANVIHPSSNDLSEDTLYTLSKLCAEKVLENFGNAYIIRCSIIGIEEKNNKSILSWFLSVNKDSIQGYSNHYWNGITTLEWAKMAYSIIKGEYDGNIFQLSSEKISKYELLKHIAEVFRPGYEIIEVEHPKYQNKCLASNLRIRKIEIMLQELKDFYNLT